MIVYAGTVLLSQMHVCWGSVLQEVDITKVMTWNLHTDVVYISNNIDLNWFFCWPFKKQIFGLVWKVRRNVKKQKNNCQDITK